MPVVAPCKRWSLGEARALLLRVDRPVGDGLSLRAGGCCLGGLVSEGKPQPSCCACTGHVEMGGLSVLVVAARKGWSVRGGQSPPA